MIRVATLLILLSGCGVVDDIGRTNFQLRELPFRVESEEGTILSRSRPELEQVVDVSANTYLSGAANLEDVRVENVAVVVRENSIGVPIEEIQFIVAPGSVDTRSVFASVADVAADETDWPELETYTEGIDHLEAFIADRHSAFLIQAAITFDVPEGYRAKRDGLLDLGFRISGSALATR